MDKAGRGYRGRNRRQIRIESVFTFLPRRFREITKTHEVFPSVEEVLRGGGFEAGNRRYFVACDIRAAHAIVNKMFHGFVMDLLLYVHVKGIFLSQLRDLVVLDSLAINGKVLFSNPPFVDQRSQRIRRQMSSNVFVS